MNRIFKNELVNEFKQIFESASIVIITQNKGLTVKDSNALRRRIKQLNGTHRVAKNSLVRIALKDTKYHSLIELMKGPTGITYSSDPVSAAKVVNDFVKNNAKLIISGAVMNEVFITSDQIQQLADLPSIEQLRSKIIGLLLAPATKVATVLQAPSTQIVRVVDAHVKKNN